MSSSRRSSRALPVKGEIVGGELLAFQRSALVNSDPFGEGWSFVIKMASPDDAKQLKDAAAYRQAIG